MKNFIKKILSNQYLNDFINFYKSAEMSLSSIAVAYYLIISLFPMLLIIGNALPYFHLNTGQILHFFQEYLPAPIFDGLEDVIKSLFEQSNPALLSFSILVGVWTFARALDALQLSMNKAYGVNLHRDFFFRRLIGIFVGIIILLFIYVMIMLTTAGGVALTLIREHIAI
ncbi:MAG: YihY/virulence factor BrkB family protein, partial [Streptococcaceae bacterium]|nr:YihY/virulence factor BrkB family protein [Streptococcaceae bacterium]